MPGYFIYHRRCTGRDKKKSAENSLLNRDAGYRPAAGLVLGKIVHVRRVDDPESLFSFYHKTAM
jgi:hypothetical protein